MKQIKSEIVIEGVTKSGKPFRPSDWAERLSGVMSTLGADNRLNYSPYVRPGTCHGVRCVRVARKLREVDPRAYNFLLGFARDNDLQVAENGDAGA